MILCMVDHDLQTTFNPVVSGNPRASDIFMALFSKGSSSLSR